MEANPGWKDDGEEGYWGAGDCGPGGKGDKEAERQRAGAAGFPRAFLPPPTLSWVTENRVPARGGGWRVVRRGMGTSKGETQGGG